VLIRVLPLIDLNKMLWKRISLIRMEVGVEKTHCRPSFSAFSVTNFASNSLFCFMSASIRSCGSSSDISDSIVWVEEEVKRETREMRLRLEPASSGEHQ
jgi:hypothetical protein